MRYIALLFIYILISLKLQGQSQGINNVWLSGYSSFAGFPFGNTHFDFYNGSPSIVYDSLPMSFSVAHANISDGNGNLLFYTNGIYLADSTHNPMQNGMGLNPSAYTTQYQNDGLAIPQADLILQKPLSNNIYYLFHSTIDENVNYYAKYLYVTTIDMTLNGGLGAVTSKNVIKIQADINAGKVGACKHANGIDWWVFCHKAYSNTFYKILVTPLGIGIPAQQNIGIVRPPDGGQMVFSPDGKRLAYYHTVEDLEVFDFDRCTGLLSNPRFVAINDSALGGGCAFSPNSDVLYLSSSKRVYQFDAMAANLAATQTTIAVWDSFYSPIQGFPSLPTFFYLSALAPDGKIYITTGNGTMHMHVINQPDSLGSACDLVQHGIQMPSIYFNTLPNHPNYFLGCDTTGGCICLVGTNDVVKENINARAAPNPNNGIFTLQFNVQSTSGELEVYDVMGNLVRIEYVAPWSQYKRVSIEKLTNGIYFCKLKWGGVEGGIKIIKE